MPRTLEEIEEVTVALQSDDRSSVEERQVWRTFSRASALLREAVGRDVEAYAGLSLNEYEILERLAEAAGEALRMAALADDLVHSRSRLTHAVHRMEARGLVERRACEADGRGVYCALTALGRHTFSEAELRHRRALQQHLVDRLGHDELAALGRVTSRVAEELSAEARHAAWSGERAG